MARIDPNQAAAAATGEPIPAAGADPLGQPIIDMQTPAPATGAQSQEEIDAAIGLGLNPNNMGADEWDFVRVFSGGGLASIAPDGDPENPLIPGEGAPIGGVPVPPTTPTQPAADAPPPAAGEGRVGPATDPEGGGSNGAPAAPSPTGVPAPEAIETPGRPAFQIPNPIPPAPEPVAPAPAAQPNLVTLPDGSVVTVETYHALLAAQQGQQPFAQQQPQYAPQPPVQQPNMGTAQQPQYPLGQQPGFVPNAWSPTPGEYVDERAAYDIAQMRANQTALEQTLAQVQLQSAAAFEAQQANSRQAIDTAVEETLHGYAGARQITYDQASDLMSDAVRLGLVGVYSQQFPGDPRRAVAAAMENVYNNTPEFRELEMNRQIEAQRAANAETERRRAFAGQTTGTPGSVPRAAAPAGTVAEKNAGIVAMIEADPAYQAQQATRR